MSEHIAQKIPISEFFAWKYHPFADTHRQRELYTTQREKKLLETIKRLLHSGKSLALCGPSGSGKTTLVHALVNTLDKHSYRPVVIPYAGHPRNGLTRILAQTLGVETKGRGVPLIARIQHHLHTMLSGANPRHPVIIIDDAQLLENESLWDLCSLLMQTSNQTTAASLILVGDQRLEKALELYTMIPIRTRLTTIMKLRPMDERETRRFIESRLQNGGASQDVFTPEALEILAATTRGNRRNLMNMATMALEEAYCRQEKTITAETLYDAEWFNEPE
jgi:general secretion pathway protein A